MPPVGSDQTESAETIVAANLEIPWALDFLPDGNILFTERPGRVKLVDKDGEEDPVLIAQIPQVKHIGEGGLLGLAIHPQTKQILGVHILAPNAGELIAEAMMLVKNKNTIDDVVNSLPMFPTLSEAIKIATLSFTKDISKLSCCI